MNKIMAKLKYFKNRLTERKFFFENGQNIVKTSIQNLRNHFNWLFNTYFDLIY